MVEFKTQQELKVTISLAAEYAAPPGDTFFDGQLVYPMSREGFTMFEFAVMDMLKGLGLATLEQKGDQDKDKVDDKFAR